MIWDYITKLRECIESPGWPLPYDKWPVELRTETNCLAFALGLTKENSSYDSFVSWTSEFPIPSFSKVFERLLDELGLEWKIISRPKEADSDEFVIQIYGFYMYRNFLDYSLDFHVIRRELDGTWVHKPDFKAVPCEIDFDSFRQEYPDNEIASIFAVRKPC